MPVEESDTTVTLTGPNRSVTVLKHGATVISWKVDGTERLWVSEAAKLDGSKPVRGGIPLVFPVFGKQKDPQHPTAKLPQHGFARHSAWEFLGQAKESPLTVEFGLGPENVDPELLKLWAPVEGSGSSSPYDFSLILSVSLAEDKLTTTITVSNSGKVAFPFQWLFHTYLRVPDITDVLVTNLVDQRCFDQLLAQEYVEKAPVVSFHEEFDRIYRKVPLDKTFQVVEFGKVLVNVHRDNLPDSVVWNPWIEKSKGMGDFEPKTGYINMLCVEPGHVSDDVVLQPGESWTGGQTLELGGEIKLQSNIFA